MSRASWARARYTDDVQRNMEHQALITRILGDSYLPLRLSRLTVDELVDATCHVKIAVTERDTLVEVEGDGVGVVDAIFASLLARYGREYASLKTISLAGFAVSANIESKRGQSGVDAVGTITIDVCNSEGNRFSFTDTSRSVTSSTARAVLSVVEYFVNSERAFITLDKARRDAMERNREDLVTRYTAEMAEIVESTSYTEVIEAIRKRIT
jgi:predicted HAD superfamily phosphohydrolase